jgi:UDP-N-acetylglucosamine transferase subunit ALG13
VIFVLMGTNPYPFTRLAAEIDALTGVHKWDTFVQCGFTQYHFNHCEMKAFMLYDEVLEKIKKCDVLVTQGGAGSISDGICFRKPVVAVPRYPKYGESQDEQSVLVQRLEQLGCVLGVYDIKNLYTVIQNSKTFVPNQPPRNRIPQIIKEFLVNLDHE